MYAGNILGMLVMMKLQDYMQTETTNPVLVLTDQGGILQRLVFFVIMAPVFEELIFRKMLIDRTLEKNLSLSPDELTEQRYQRFRKIGTAHLHS